MSLKVAPSGAILLRRRGIKCLSCCERLRIIVFEHVSGVSLFPAWSLTGSRLTRGV